MNVAKTLAPNHQSIGALCQLHSILTVGATPVEVNDAVCKLIASQLTWHEESVASALAWESASLPELDKYRGKLTYSYLLKNVQLRTIVAFAATLSHKSTTDYCLVARVLDGKWTTMGDHFGFEVNTWVHQVKPILEAQLNGKSILEGCSLYPNGPFPHGFLRNSQATTATPSTTATTSTQGVSSMSFANINPAVKPLIDGMLAQSGINMTIDSIVNAISQRDELITEKTVLTAQHDKEVNDLRTKLAAKAAMPTTLTIQSTQGIPNGTMEMVDACTVFPQLKGLTLSIPHFVWDAPHPEVPVINGDYIFRKEMLIKALRCLAVGENVWLGGHTGSGKTTFIEQIAARLEWPVARVAFDSNVDRSELVGRMQLKGDGKGGTISEWLPGILERAITNNYILLCDEMDAGHPNALYTLQPLLEGKGLNLLEDGGRIVPMGQLFRMAATGNTTGNGDPSGLYPACRILSAATLDRFQNFINVPYMSSAEEAKLIGDSVPGISKTLINKLVKFGGEMRQAFVTGQTPISYSPRRSVAFAREVFDLQQMGYKDETVALTAAFKSKLYDAASEEFRQRITEIANACFGGIDPTKSLD
jgi:cobaltochelatase CobS